MLEARMAWKVRLCSVFHHQISRMQYDAAGKARLWRCLCAARGGVLDFWKELDGEVVPDFDLSAVLLRTIVDTGDDNLARRGRLALQAGVLTRCGKAADD